MTCGSWRSATRIRTGRGARSASGGRIGPASPGSSTSWREAPGSPTTTNASPCSSTGKAAPPWRCPPPAEIGPEDDRAIIRDNRPHGYPTLTLLVCAATIGATGVSATMATLDDPGAWNDVSL